MRMSEEEWSSVINTNLNSLYYVCSSVIRPMIKARSGSIINISSVVGLMGSPGQTNYAAAKA
ncbi:3-oxoacyl-[acyl-carrier-protein] reductase FabG, partial [Chlamydia psittaci 84-8471/1]